MDFYGEGIALLQKRTVDSKAGNPIDDEIEQVYAVHVKPGDNIFIPSGWGHLVANISNTYFVTADDSIVNFDEQNPVSLPGHADLHPLRNYRVFAITLLKKIANLHLLKTLNIKMLRKFKS